MPAMSSVVPVQLSGGTGSRLWPLSRQTCPKQLPALLGSIFVPLGCTHRLENPGTMPLNLIEVQSGSYLGEDEIVRIDDVYNRA